MSKQTINLIGKPIVFFLNQVIENKKMKPIKNAGKMLTVMGQHWLISVYAEEPITRSTIEMGFVIHDSLPLYLVCGLNITNAKNSVLAGRTLLLHYGKNIASTQNTANADVGSFWTIKNAAGVEALLREYDNLARIHRMPIIFDLP
jgi:hypothetical protein